MLLMKRVKHFIEILTFILKQEGWRCYFCSSNGRWQRVKLPRGSWQHTFCADPFLFRYERVNWLFVETKTLSGKGIVGCLKEVGGKWVWQGVALEEPCHLSYPQVFEEDGKIYMIPESCKRNPGDICLYEAIDFPLKWKKTKVLIDRPFADCTILKRNGHWYMACYNRPPDEHAELWHSDKLAGTWARHPACNEITQTRRLMRCGGYFIEREGNLYRVAQDCDGFYGIRLWKVPVEELSPTSYREGLASILIGELDRPKGMKHTYNEIVIGSDRLCVVDVHHDVFRPFGEIVRRLGVAIGGKLGIRKAQ